MAVAFRSAGALASSATGSPVVSMPAGVAAGDVLIMQYACDNSVTPTTPTGWTNVFGPVAMSGGAPNRGYLFARVAGASEPATVTVAHTGSNNPAGGIISAYTGVDNTTPVDVYATATIAAPTTTGTTPSVTTTKANDMLLRMYWQYTGGAMSITPPGTDTERYDAGDATNLNLGFELATSVKATAGATGTTSASFASNAIGGLAATVALAEAPSVITPVADFTGSPLTGVAPLSVTFTDASTNTPTSWAWTFGDGGTSTSQNPTHSYTAAGTYTVVLVATNAAGSNTKTRTGYVTVSSAFVPQITVVN